MKAITYMHNEYKQFTPSKHTMIELQKENGAGKNQRIPSTVMFHDIHNHS